MLNIYYLYTEHRDFQGQGRKDISFSAYNACCLYLERTHMNEHTLHADIHRERGKALFFSLYRAHILSAYRL